MDRRAPRGLRTALVEALAGTGKTFAAGAQRRVYEDTGQPHPDRPPLAAQTPSPPTRPPPPPGAPYPELWVPEARFRSEMTALARAGYHATTLDRVWRAWHAQATMPRDPIVVSFDDGYLSQYTHARPDLHRLRWPAVLNVARKRTPSLLTPAADDERRARQDFCFASKQHSPSSPGSWGTVPCAD